jgi:hypothetical protein
MGRKKKARPLPPESGTPVSPKFWQHRGHIDRRRAHREADITREWRQQDQAGARSKADG